MRVRAEEFLGAVLAAAAQPIWVVGPDGLVRFANRAAIEALGYDAADELLGRDSHDTIHDRRRDGNAHSAVDCRMLRPRATGETVSSDLDWFSRRDGSLFPASYVSAPIDLPDGRGAVVAFAGIEDRSRVERMRRHNDAVLEAHQAALRRVAMLVAGGAASPEVFAAIAREVAQVLSMALVVIWRYEPGRPAIVVGAWSDRPHPFQTGTGWPVEERTAAAILPDIGRPSRVADFGEIGGAITDAIRQTGVRSGAGAAITVDGEFWGVMGAGVADREPLPDHIEDRLAEFTELIATAIANTASQAEVGRLADEQAALRRVATLVARSVAPPDVFAAVAGEVGVLFGVDATHLVRFDLDGTATGVAAWSPAGNQRPAGTHVDLDGDSVAGSVLRTGRPARMHGYENARGAAAALGRELGVRSSVGAPIVVDQRLWGVMIVSSKDERELPLNAEARIAAFTDLVATAISNTDAREQVGRLAEEQAALRRLAMLAARGVPSSELFGAVGEEVGRLIGADHAAIVRYESDNIVTAIAGWAAAGEPIEVGRRWPLEEAVLAATAARTRRAARTDDYGHLPERVAGVRERLGIRSSVVSPIAVDGRQWGALYVHSTRSEPLPADTEARLVNFTELVATAMSNAHARAEVQRLADEQAALRRVATLVARGSSPAEVFGAVAEELGRLLVVEGTRVIRYQADGTAILVASWGEQDVAVGTHVTLAEDNVGALVRQTGRPARIDDYSAVTGSLAALVQALGFRSVIGSPILVEGGVWGAMIALSRQTEPLPAETESRIGEFTELAATAIANVQARSELAASRARIAAATDDERRRVVRDLHDGAQQRLVHTIITLKLASRALGQEQDAAAALVHEALENAERANVELRALAHGILPTVLTRGGLGSAVAELASRMPLPVEIDVSVDRLPAAVEATAYFVVAEALTNVAKHAGAGHAEVTAQIDHGALAIVVRDDGVGDARPDGSGLVGLADRLAALDGGLRIESPADGGTVLMATIPVPS